MTSDSSMRSADVSFAALQQRPKRTPSDNTGRNDLSRLPQIADEHRREIIGFYLGLRLLFLAVSFVLLLLFPQQLTRPQLFPATERLWEAWSLFALWSIPLFYIANKRRLGDERLALADRFIFFSLIPDSIAIFLAGTATGGTAGLVYRSVYFLIAVHSYHFSPVRFTSQTWTPRGTLLPLGLGASFTVFCGMSVYCGLAEPRTPILHFVLEFGLQAITAVAFLLVRFSDVRRAQRLALSEASLGRARETERRLLQAMQGVSTIARISDEAELIKKLRGLTRVIGESLDSEYCVLGLIRGDCLDVVARHPSFALSKQAKTILHKLASRPVGDGLVGSVLARGRPFSWSDDRRDFVDLTDDELKELGVSLDREGTRRLRDHVLPSRAVRHLVVSPFYSQDDDHRPLGYILLINRVVRAQLSTTGFTTRDVDRLAAIADQLAIATTNFQRHQADTVRAENEAFLSSLMLTTDLDDLFDRVLTFLNREYDSRVASLWLATEDGFGTSEETLRIVLRSVIVAEDSRTGGAKARLEERLKKLNIFGPTTCYIGRFFLTDTPAVTYVDDVSETPDCWASCRSEIGTSHLIVIPLCRYHDAKSRATDTIGASTEQPLAGVICLRPIHGFVLTPERRAALERFANHIAVIIDQVRFRRRYRQIEVLKDGLPALQIADLDAFYSGVVRLVKAALTAEACSLFNVAADNALILRATTAPGAIRVVDGKTVEIDTAECIGKAAYVAGEHSITGRIATLRQTTLIYDVQRNKERSKLFIEVTDTPNHQSLIGAPIIHTDGTLLGVLRCVNRKKAGALLPVFVQGDKEFLDLIVGILARFIENAEASASKRHFLIELGHELSTPLAALRSQIEFLDEIAGGTKHVKDPEEQFAYLREQAEFIQYLVNDIQYQFGKGATIRTRFEFTRLVDLRPIIERIKKLLLPTARADKKIDIRTRTTPMPPLYVDARRMEQVIFNLVQNAVKYSQAAAGNIFIDYDLVEEGRGVPKGEWHRLTFRNWGVGVRESDLPFIFDEYRRGSNVEGAPSGTGLGLAVSKRIVEAHGGKIVATHLHHPTVFAVFLPEYLSRRPPADASASN